MGSVLHRLGIVVVSLGVVSGAASGALAADPKVEIASKSYFTAPDGSQVEVAAGTYTVTVEAEDAISLTPASGPAVQIAVEDFAHGEEIEESRATFSPTEEDKVYLLLYLTAGAGQVAVGNTTGVATRGASRTAYRRGTCPSGFGVKVISGQASCHRRVNEKVVVGNPACPPLSKFSGDENDVGWDLCRALAGTLAGPVIPCIGSEHHIRKGARDQCRITRQRDDYRNMSLTGG